MVRREKWGSLLVLLLSVSLLSAGCTAFFLQRQHKRAGFLELSRICWLITEQASDPEKSLEQASESEQSLDLEQVVLAALKEYQSSGEEQAKQADFLSRYGYDEKNFGRRGYSAAYAAASSAFGVLLFFVFLFWQKHQKRKRIEELTLFLERVNQGRGALSLVRREDDFSMLEDEIYKTVTSLRETRESALLARGAYAANLANIAHQLKTPLTAAGISLQMLRETADPLYLEKILGQLSRLTALEEALLQLSRIDSGNLELEKKPVDVYTVLSLAADNLEELALEKGVSIEIESEDCASFTGDLEWTMEALMNLLKNCLEHTPSGGTVRCGYSENPVFTEIRIWDEGEGFSKEDLPRLFERFYRGKHASKEGVGIGLSLSREIFELQNGSVSAKNNPEKGAVYEIRFYRH